MDEDSKKVSLEVDLDKWIPTETSTLLQIIAAELAVLVLAVVIF